MSVGVVDKQTGDRIPTAGMPAIDAALSGSSTNPVQNRVVKAALDEKADTDIVAGDFSAATSYTAGDYCIYEGKFYKFKANHSGAWSASDVDEIKIAGELSSLMSGLTDYIKLKLVTIPCTELTNGKNLTDYVIVDSGYKFLCWQINGYSDGWIANFPIYLSLPDRVSGVPYWSGTLGSGSVIFAYFEIKSA